MDNEIQLISDGISLAVIGGPAAVDRFLISEGLTESRDFELPRLSNFLSAGSGIADAASAIAANSGRWMMVTEKSQALIKAHGLMKSSTSGLNLGVVQEHGGKIKGIVEFAKGPGTFLANPAILAGAAGIMAQLAMKQSMDEITEYLAVIDEKVEEVLRAQKDTALADMIGAGFVIDEAMTLRDEVGSVSEVTWSKVQATSFTIARTQAYALRQLDALAEKLEKHSNAGDLARLSKEAETTVREWLAVLARCFQLEDAMALLELDRVMDAVPEDLEQHRVGLRIARQNRLELIARSTGRLIARVDATAVSANKKVLLHPFASPVVVNSSNSSASAIGDFHLLLGLQRDRQLLEARPWGDAATEMKGQVLDTGADVVGVAKRIGSDGLDRTRSAAGKLYGRIVQRTSRRREDGNSEEEMNL